jgi:MoxR-like ATPase
VTQAPTPDSIRDPEALREILARELYFAETSLATAIFLTLRLGKPLFLEGEAGVGKTEVAKTLSRCLGGRLVRLQCYEGLDLATAVYEWDYSRQLLHIRLLEAAGEVQPGAARDELFQRDFLLRRPLLEAVTFDPQEPTPVLLIDELDRADEEFEAFLLELLSDFQISIPELGTLRAPRPPIVVITSNRTREIHDALRRRCLYHWVDYPDFDKELQIVEARCPGADAELSRQVVRFVQTLRREDLYKRPGVAETLDWVRALEALDRHVLTPETVDASLSALLKYQDDVELVRRIGLEGLLARAETDVEAARESAG